MSDAKQEIKRVEEGDAWRETDEVVKVEVKRPLDKVIPVRLPWDVWDELRREARDLGIGPTTLARMWILEKLRHSNPDHAASLRRERPGHSGTVS